MHVNHPHVNNSYSSLMHDKNGTVCWDTYLKFESIPPVLQNYTLLSSVADRWAKITYGEILSKQADSFEELDSASFAVHLYVSIC